jgi:formylglycine-generating enzyme required for sulfatase activity
MIMTGKRTGYMITKTRAISVILRCVAASAAALLVSCSFNPFAPRKISYAALEVASEGNGTVFITPGGGKVPAGSEVFITAAAGPGYVFAGFFGDVRSTNNPLHLFVTANIADTARFVKQPDLSTMAEIRARGATFTMGSDAVLSQANERPPHRVSFTYDYFIDRCEVTQGMYSTVMGTNPSTANATQGTFGIGDSFPVYYVSFYDAARFCNQRSKIDGYDTVYSYTAVCAGGAKCPYVLENLAAHCDRMGYRLPTEAEWEYACRAGSTSGYFWGDSAGSRAQRYAWYGGDMGNSNNTSHPVGKTQPNPFGLYDMTGNVSEFVGDWLGPYGDSLIVNPVGPADLNLEQFEASWQRPVRGGCYSLGTSFLRSAGRSEPYPAPAFTAGPHTGFRTVLGVFFPDTAAYAAVHASDTLGVTVACAKSDLISLIGTSRVKIAFVKEDNTRRRLCYIDFSAPDIAVRAIADSVPAYGPALSPNGASVAYGSRSIGFSSPSQTTVRRLTGADPSCVRTPPGNAAYLPSWWVDPATLDTCIVYGEGASMNNAPAWVSERTMRQHMSGLAFAGPAEAINADGSYHGGISKNGLFLATGYPNAYFYDIRLDIRIRYFLPPYSGRDDTAQVCNVSITPGVGRPDEIMFLDFGYPSKPSTVVGKPYRFHSIIFICNSCVLCNTHVKRWYEVPAGFDEWDCLKWSNHPDFAAAAAKPSGTGSGSSLFIINLKDSSYLRVASGDGLCDPYCWIDPTAVAELPDPYADFAQYDVPMEVNYGGQLQITKKLKLFWKQRAAFDVGVFGSSPAYYGVDPAYMPSFSAVNMSVFMGEMLLSEVLAMQYTLANAPNLKAVVLGLDPGFLNTNSNWADPFLNGLYDSQGYRFDKRNNFWKAGLPPEAASKIAGFGPTSWGGFDSAGYTVERSTGSWGQPIIDKGDYAISDTFVQINLRHLAALADTFAAHAIQVLVVQYPENPAYKTTPSIARYGPSRTTYGQLVQWLDSLSQANPFFHFYDANSGGEHDYADSEAFDANHLNYLGARKLSARLDSVLNVYVK